MSGITFSILGAPELLPLKTKQRTTEMDQGERQRPKNLLGSVRNSLSRKQSNPRQQQAHPHATNVAPATRRPVGVSANPFHSPSSFDAPPPYSPASPPTPPYSPASIQAPQETNASNSAPIADDQYAFLSSFDTKFVIDDSGSMAGGLWRQAAEAVMTITPICTAHDDDGIDIHFLNHREGLPYKNITNPTRVKEIFDTVRPGGGTPIGVVLNKIFKAHIEAYRLNPDSTKPINVICITDGVPTDDPERALIDGARKLDQMEAPAWQVGVQFFQVGQDAQATQFLKSLDDELADMAGDRDMRDMVDTVPFTNADGGRLTADGILKVVLGAVTRRLDRRSRDLHR